MSNPHSQSTAVSHGLLWKRLLLFSTAGILLIPLLVLIGIWNTGASLYHSLRTLLLPGHAPAQVDVRSLVVDRLRQASELTTTVYTTETIVPTSQDRLVGRFVIGTTKLLYIAHGQVRAGVDLGQIGPEDVTATTDRLQIQLPPPQILDSKIDVSRSSVYTYDRGFLSLGPDVAPVLQTEAEQTALEQILASACAADLLKEANVQARQVVNQLLTTTNQPAPDLSERSRQIAIQTQQPAPDACPTEVEASPSTNV